LSDSLRFFTETGFGQSRFFFSGPRDRLSASSIFAGPLSEMSDLVQLCQALFEMPGTSTLARCSGVRRHPLMSFRDESETTFNVA